MATYINAWLDAHPDAAACYITGSKLVVDSNGILSLETDTDEIVEALDLGTLRSDVDDLKSDLDTLDTKISVAVKEVDEETSTDTEMLSRSDFTAGIMSPNGTVTSSSAIGYLNTPIAVEPGETIRATKYYYNSKGKIAGQAAGSFRACAFFADNTFTYTNNGFSTARDSFEVPEGVYYIQPSISALMTGTYNYAKIHRVTYSVSYALSDELAETIASPKLQALNNGTLTTKDLANSYACAMPKTDLRMTVGIPEKWYKKCMCTPPTDFVFATYGYSTTEHYNKYTEFPNEDPLSSINGYYWRHYDPLLNLIDSYDGSAGFGGKRRVIAENLSDCSVLVIGDSTVDHDTMTGKMLSYFTEKGHTLTLLGTLVSRDNPLNRNEGRAGWTTADYLADTTENGYTNPFWNPNSSSFDFSYYMTQQSYAGVDFVVIQLGINDLYPSTSVGAGSPKETVWQNIKTMIDSILSYNASTKIILNLPTTPHADESQHRISEFMYRNAVVQYNAYAMSHALSEYTDAKVRCSYCHLILDPETEIRDNVHPTVTGYEKMALEVISQINVWQNGY